MIEEGGLYSPDEWLALRESDKRQETISKLSALGVNRSTIEDLYNDGLSAEEIEQAVKGGIRKTLHDLCGEEHPQARTAKAAADYPDETPRFVWRPYIPVGDFSVLMAAGGTGKSVFTCGIAADISQGRPLPGEIIPCKNRNVLFFYSVDSGSLYKRRLQASGADLSHIYIVDRELSEGMDLHNRFREFELTIEQCRPSLIIIDPWHGFITDVDISRANCVRPVFHAVANLARRHECGILLISHVNKRAQGENANNAATGSSDLINAARSAISLIFDGEDATNKNSRIAVHTKSNLDSAGQSIRFQILSEGGCAWTGFSPITRETLEEAARKRSTPSELLQSKQEDRDTTAAIIAGIMHEAIPGKSVRLAYDEFSAKYGAHIFSGGQPKRRLDSVSRLLDERGIHVKTGLQKKINGANHNAFTIFMDDDGQEEIPED